VDGKLCDVLLGSSDSASLFTNGAPTVTHARVTEYKPGTSGTGDGMRASRIQNFPTAFSSLRCRLELASAQLACRETDPPTDGGAPFRVSKVDCRQVGNERDSGARP
jgi:hypothetical protein